MECNYAEELIFQTGFNNTTLSNDAYQNTIPSGTDASLLSNNSWEGFNNHANIGEVKIHYEDGDDSQRLAKIVDDPDNMGNKALQFQLFEPHIKVGNKKHKGRVQLGLRGNQCIRQLG